MSAISVVNKFGYTEGMALKAPPSARRTRARRSAGEPTNKRRPNRIYELTKARGWNYGEVAQRLGVHEITVTRLSTGKMQLTQEWMERLAGVFLVAPAEIIEAPVAGLRRVIVTCLLQGGGWAETHALPDADQYSVMVPDDPSLRDLYLYGGELRDQSMNLRYPAGTVIVLSRLRQRPNEIVEGRRYHVRVIRKDGQREDSLKTLVKRNGGYWLKPESDDPAHQEWMPVDGRPGETIELVGRVRFVVARED